MAERQTSSGFPQLDTFLNYLATLNKPTTSLHMGRNFGLVAVCNGLTLLCQTLMKIRSERESQEVYTTSPT